MSHLMYKRKIKKGKVLGVIGPEPTDIRNYELASIQPESVALPAEYDLRDRMTSIQKQNYGSCTSHAVDGVKEYLDSQEAGKAIKLSQKFIYYNTKKISQIYTTEGDYVKNALKSVCDYGACLEETFPDNKLGNWNEYVHDEPSAMAYEEAKKYKGKTYWAVGNKLEDFRQAVFQQKCPTVFSMAWASSYNSTPPNGVLLLPDKIIGGHAISCAGWTKEEKLIVRNSWDVSYGDKGYFYIPFAEFEKHEIWNDWILLDYVPVVIEGWVAGEYLKRMVDNGFSKGEKVLTIERLNVRENPGINAKKISILDANVQAEIIEGGIMANNFKWYKIKVVN